MPPKLSPEPGQASVPRAVPLQPGREALGLRWALLEVSQAGSATPRWSLTLVAPLSRQQVLHAQGALAKDVHGQVLSWMVRRVRNDCSFHKIIKVY